MFKPNKYLNFWVKLIIGLVVIAFVGWKIYQMMKSESYKGPFETQFTWPLITVVLALMVVNWSIETVKWKALMQTLKPLTFKEAFASVLAGISTGIITPNRLGNFIGRTMLLEKEIKTKATLLTFLSNLSQFVPTVFFGCLGLLAITTNYQSQPHLIIFCSGILLLILALVLYMHPKHANRKPFNYLFTSKIIEAINFIEQTPAQIKLSLLGLSALRYLVFLAQYVLLLLLFEQNQGVFVLVVNVSMVYLLMTIIPGLLFGKLFVREAAGLLVLGQIGVPDAVILATGFILWLINIGVPSLAGTIFLFRKK